MKRGTRNFSYLRGRTGAGKEKDLLAAAIHYDSIRKSKLFIIQNCTAFHYMHLSSELFGHEKSFLFNALSDQPGFSVSANGRLFLDFIHGCSHPGPRCHQPWLRNLCPVKRQLVVPVSRLDQAECGSDAPSERKIWGLSPNNLPLRVKRSVVRTFHPERHNASI